MNRWRVLQRLAPLPLLSAMALASCGLVFIGSATRDDPQFAAQQLRQALFLATSTGIGLGVLLVHYLHVLRSSWWFYGAVVLALLGLPFFAPELNGARRWYAFPAFSIQPGEFAKLAVVLALAQWLRFKSRARTFEGLLVPMAIAGLPAFLILRQPDLGSALVFAPVLLAMCHAAGTPRRTIAAVLLGSAALAFLGYFLLHDYQRERVDCWRAHWSWMTALHRTPESLELLRGPGYQPWQALIALGSGGYLGHGLGAGPQNRFDFLPYRSEDYVFAVVGEEAGWLGCLLVLALIAGLVVGLLQLAADTRERYGRLVCVGVASWIGAQSLMHIAVCAWVVPATGLPLPLVSYGGSSSLAVVLSIAICLNIGARREPILAADGYQ